MPNHNEPLNPIEHDSELAGKATAHMLVKVGHWHLDAGAGRITDRSGKQKRLTPKTLQVLLMLLEQPGVTVSRSDILDGVWGTTYPSDYVVSRAIADLRSAFGEEAKSAGYIKTVPKLGYRLVADVSYANQANRLPQRKWLMGGLVLLIIGGIFFAIFNKKDIPSDSNMPLARPVTSGPGLEQQSRIAANGEWLVFASLGKGDSDWDIYSQSLDGGTPQAVAISKAVEHGPALSPSGEEVAYVRLENNECKVVWQTLYQGVPQPLASCSTKFPTTVDWSPDGQFIAFTAPAEGVNGERSIHLVNRRTGESTLLTHGVPEGGTDYYPRFSPDGSQLAFLRGAPKPEHRSHILVVDLGTQEQYQVTQVDSLNAGLTWLDDEQLLYVIREAGRLVTLVTDVRTGQTYDLPLRDVFQPDYHLASKSLSMAKVHNDSDISLFNLANQSIQYIAESTSSDWGGELSPDGRWLTFVSTRTGSNQLWLVSIANGALRQLTQLDNADIESPHWNPDSETILFSVKQGDQQQLFSTHIVTGDIGAIDTSGYAATSGRWLPTGGNIIFSCQDEQSWKLCMLSLDRTGDLQVILNAQAYDPVFDEQSNRVFFTRDEPGLWAMDMDSKLIELIWSDLPKTLGHGWTIDQNAVYYLRASTQVDVVQLERRDLTSGQTNILHRGAIPSFNSSLEMSSDGNQLVFPSWRSAQDDIVLFKPVVF